jgi:phosphotransferase system HPr (HPr) family protein
MMKSLSFSFPLKMGLHARPASAIENLCSDFEAEVTLINTRNELSGSATSAVSLIAMDVQYEDIVQVQIRGELNFSLYEAFKDFVENQLPHIDDADESSGVSSDWLSPVYHSLGGHLTHGVALSTGKVLNNWIPYQVSLEIPTDSPIAMREKEWEESHTVFEKLEQRLSEENDQYNSGQSQLVEAHLSLLRDPLFKGEVLNRVESGDSFVVALDAVSSQLQAQFQASQSEIIRQRGADIKDLVFQLKAIAFPDALKNNFTEPDEDYILVGKDLPVSFFINLDGDRCKGVVCSGHSINSHLAILCRSLEIPAISIDENELTELLKLSQGPLFLEGESGVVIASPDENALSNYLMCQEFFQCRLSDKNLPDLNSENGSELSLQLLVNATTTAECKRFQSLDAQGIGLYRTELIYLDREELPSLEELSQLFYQLYEALLDEKGNVRKGVIRLPDIGGDKPSALFPQIKEENPFLGVRGVRLYPRMVTILETLIKALFLTLIAIEKEGKSWSPWIMVPMVSRVDELLWVRAKLKEIADELNYSGGSLKVGMMVEIPSAALSPGDLFAHCDFISVGTNDLQQYLFAADRGNSALYRKEEMKHPAFLQTLYHLAKEAKKAGIPASVCGEAASEMSLLPFWVGAGFTSLSLSLPQFQKVKQSLAQLNLLTLNKTLDKLFNHYPLEQEVNQWFSKVESELNPFFQPQRAFIDVDISSKSELIHHLAQCLTMQGASLSAALLEEDILKRESQWSTSLGFGFAIPHCKSEAVTSPALVALTLKNPIVWNEKEPDQKVHSVVLLTASANDAQNNHLKIFSKLARKLMHEEFRTEFSQAKEATALYQFLQNEL